MGPETVRTWAYGALLAVAASITWSISLFVISSVVLIALAVLHCALERRAPLPKSAFEIAVVIYVCVVASSALVTSYPYETFRGVLKVARQAALCLAVVWALSDRVRVRRFMTLWMIVAGLTGMDALVQGVTGWEPIRGRAMTPFFGETLRWTGPYRHANDFSAFLTIALFPFVGLVSDRYSSLRSRIVASLGLVLCVVGLYNAYSRGAWLAVAIGLALLAVLRRDKVLGAIIVSGLVWMVFLSPELAQQRVRALFDPAGGTVRERRLLWAEAAAMIAERPLLGWGVNTYAKNEPLFKPQGSAAPDHQYAHNGYLQMAAEVGLVGLAAFVAVFVSGLSLCLKRLIHAPPSTERTLGLALAAGIVSFLVHSATDTNLQSILLVNTLWLSLGVCLALSGYAGAKRSS